MPVVCLLISAMIFLGCSPNGGDEYLDSLKLPEVQLSPLSVIDLDELGITSPGRIAKQGEYIAISQDKGDFVLNLMKLGTCEILPLIRKGRGPGEALRCSSLQNEGDRVIFYDSGSAVCVSIDCEKSFRNGVASMDTIARFNRDGVRPYFMAKAGDYFISANVTDPGSWYCCFTESGTTHRGIGLPRFESITQADPDFRTSLSLSSVFASNGAGDKVCAANVATSAISFSALRGGMLEEYRRYEYNPPEVICKDGYTVFSDRSRDSFHSIASDDSSIFLLYSGNRMFGDELPGSECIHLVEYGWDGLLKRYFRLSHPVSSICLDDGRLYAVSNYKTLQMYVYDVDDRPL